MADTSNEIFELTAGQSSDGTMMACRKCNRLLHRKYNQGEDQLYWFVRELMAHPGTGKEFLMSRGYECSTCTPEMPA